MDKYNIIVPTSDLDALTKDICDWYNLPFNIRMRSNDDCMRIYGCTVTDLYNKIKDKILNHEDWRSTDSDNIVKENFSSYEYYRDRLYVSKSLQSSPYIVIIDPDIDNTEELNIRYNSFNSLNAKNKRISNDYSWQLWGYNVYDMYNKVLVSIDNTNNHVEDSNIIKESYTSKTEYLVNSKKSYVDHCLLEGDYITAMNNTSEYRLYEGAISTKVIMNESLSNIVIESGNSIMLSDVPFFTENEIRENGITIKIDPNRYYRDQLVEAFREKDNTNRLLELGWNPNVPLNTESIAVARSKQLRNLYNYIDVRNFKESGSAPMEQLKVIYLIFGYNSESENMINKFNYSKAAISFTTDITSVYVFDGVEDSFKGFTLVDTTRDDSFRYIDIAAIFVDEESYKAIYENAQILLNNEDIVPGFETVYNVCNICKDINNPEAVKILYNKYVDILLRVASLDLYTKEVNFEFFATHTNKGNCIGKVFKVYSGELTNYNSQRILDIMQTLNNIPKLKNYMTEVAFNKNDVDKLVDIYTPINLIYSL